MIEKVLINDVIKFRQKSEKSRKTFVKNLSIPKKPKKEGDKSGGGNYWASCLGGIDSAFKQNNNLIIKERVNRVEEYYFSSEIKKTKERHQRNIDILKRYIGFDFVQWRPILEIKFLTQPKSKSILNINGLPIGISPSHIFSYTIDGNKYIAGIWFVVLLEGFSINELGVFSEAIYRCLTEYYSEEFLVKPEDCMVVDIVNCNKISYNSILKGEVKPLLDGIIDDINNLIY